MTDQEMGLSTQDSAASTQAVESLDGEDVKGRFLDLSETGALLLEQAGGRRRAVTAGDVSIVMG